MIKINLRHYYPHYSSDVFIEVPDDIAIELHTLGSGILLKMKEREKP